MTKNRTSTPARIAWPLAAAAAILGCGQSALLVSLPALADVTGLNSFELATLVAAGGGLFVLGNPFWGWWSDRFGRNTALSIGLLGFTVSQLAMAVVLFAEVSHPFMALLACRLLYGSTASAIYPVAQSWLCDAPLAPGETSVAPRLSKLGAAVNAGRLLGPLLAVLLIWFSPAVVLLVLGALALPLPFFCTRLASYRNRETPHTPKTEPRRILPLLLAAAALSAAMGLLQYTLGFALRDHTGSGTDAGLASAAILIVTSFIVLLLQLRLFARLQNPWRFAVPLALLAIVAGSLTGALLSGPLALLLCCVLVASGVACLVPVYLAAAGMGSGRRGQLAGWFGAAHTSGQSGGAWLAGYLLLFGASHTFYAITALAFFSAIALGCHRFHKFSSLRELPFLLSLRKYYE